MTKDWENLQKLYELSPSKQQSVKSMTKKEFTVLFRYLCKESGFSDNELAKRLQVSRPTIGRWMSGIAAPHEVGRKPIINFLISQQPINFK